MSALLLAGASALGLALISVYLRDLRLSYEVGESTRAIFAADSAIEYQLYMVLNNSDIIEIPIMSNNTSYTSSIENDVLRGVGESRGIRRGIEIYLGANNLDNMSSEE
jgi:hypothetical protein